MTNGIWFVTIFAVVAFVCAVLGFVEPQHARRMARFLAVIYAALAVLFLAAVGLAG